MDSSLGKRITANRKRLGLTQDQLAEKLGITAQAVSKWENDLSCPDISILPKLADIFGITTDELLGREAPVRVCETQVVTEPVKEDNGFTFDNGKLDLHWDGGKLEGIGLACWVILTGIVYLIAQLKLIDINFWNVLWTTFLLVFGVFGLYPKFSVFRLGCALVGGYFLIEKLQLLSFKPDNSILIAVAVLLFGLSLLADTLRKRKKRRQHGVFTDGHGQMVNEYTIDGNSFTFDASFGSNTQLVQMETLHNGNISTNFGEYTVDLSGVTAIEEPCRISADCCFGELTILVPRCYAIVPDRSTSFASFEIIGNPDVSVKGTIHLNATVSFGEITIHYV